MAIIPEIDPASALQFVINGAAGSNDADTKRAVIEAALASGGPRVSGKTLRLINEVPGLAAVRAFRC